MLASIVAVSFVAGSTVGFATAVLGAVALAVGTVRGTELGVTVGTGGLFGAVLLTGVGGKPPGWYLVATLPVVFAWTTATYRLRLARQVRPGPSTVRIEAIHAVSTLVVLVLAGGIGYLVYRSVTGSRSPLALAVFVVAVLAFSVVIHRRDH